MPFLSQAAIRSVSPDEAGDASGLYNAARNLGGSFALAGIAVVQDQRIWLHARRIEETLNANSTSLTDYIAAQAQRLGGATPALQGLSAAINRQALIMTFADLFTILTAVIVVTSPLIFFLRPLPKNAPVVVTH